MKSQDILPDVLSLIILVAALEEQSKLFAALTATMPRHWHYGSYTLRTPVIRQKCHNSA
jgi:hypothetical protein